MNSLEIEKLKEELEMAKFMVILDKESDNDSSASEKEVIRLNNLINKLIIDDTLEDLKNNPIK